MLNNDKNLTEHIKTEKEKLKKAKLESSQEDAEDEEPINSKMDDGSADESSNGGTPTPQSETQGVQSLPLKLEAYFKNIYEPTPAEPITITGREILNGRELQKNEFTFYMYSTEAGFQLSENTECKSAQNDKTGNFSFDLPVFKKVGTYYFVVLEESANPLPGVTYDKTRFHLVVDVVDNNGTLVTNGHPIVDEEGNTRSFDSVGVQFTNQYQARDCSITIPGLKKLSGKDMNKGDFDFRLYTAQYDEANGYTNKAQYPHEVSNADDGSFSFTIDYKFDYTQENARFPQPCDTNYYIISERPGDDDNVTYDDTEYGVWVMVKDDLKGQLHAEILKIEEICEDGTLEKVDKIVFNNKYSKPEKIQKPSGTAPTETILRPEDTKLPQTGQLWWPVPLLMALGVLFILVGLKRRRGKPNA